MSSSAPVVLGGGVSSDLGLAAEIIRAVRAHNQKCPHKTYYFQSKRPEYFGQLLPQFPSNVVLLTTLETNRDAGYDRISSAPQLSERYQQFLNLQYSTPARS